MFPVTGCVFSLRMNQCMMTGMMYGLAVSESMTLKSVKKDVKKVMLVCRVLLTCMSEIVTLEGVYHVMCDKLCISFH
jgi:hypothetical protein